MSAGLWNSRKFRLLLYDMIISLLLYFGAKYAAPSVFADIQVVIAILQAPVLAVIGGIAYEDGQSKRGGYNLVGDITSPQTMAMAEDMRVHLPTDKLVE